jgi:hypothetical protein
MRTSNDGGGGAGSGSAESAPATVAGPSALVLLSIGVLLAGVLLLVARRVALAVSRG